MFLLQIYKDNLQFITFELLIPIAFLFGLLFYIYYILYNKYKITKIPLIMGDYIIFVILLSIIYISKENYLINNIAFLTSAVKLDILSIIITPFILTSVLFYFITQRNTFKHLINYKSEYILLILMAIIGILYLNIANHLIIIYLALEIQSLSFYSLSTSSLSSTKAKEAALKYLVFGAIASTFYLLGASYIYGATGSLNLSQIYLIIINQQPEQLTLIILGFTLIIISLLFKLGVAPFHFLIPDIYEGVETHIAMFFATIPKIVTIVLIYRIIFDICASISEFFFPILYISIILSGIVGTFGAFSQIKLKRFVAYSSIGHFSLIFAGILTNNIIFVLVYTIIYIIIGLNLWLILSVISNKNKPLIYITDLTNIYKTHKLISICLMINLITSAGIPPFSGFLIKFFILSGTYQTYYYGIVLFFLILNVINVFFYLNIVKIIFFDKKIKNKNLFISIPKLSLFCIVSSTLLLIILILIFPQLIKCITNLIECFII